MTNQPSFVGENAASQQELRALVASLSDSDLAQDMGEGWTVAAMLAHMAFYDFRAAAAVDRWSREDHIDPFPVDPQMTNIATTPFFLAIPARSAAQLALQAAEMADGRMAGLGSALADRIAAAERSVSLFRSAHRREHIDQIKKALAAGQRSAPAAG